MKEIMKKGKGKKINKTKKKRTKLKKYEENGCDRSWAISREQS